ncbi:MAG TPA: LysR family transcriptional regulator [Dissulfurispiraceae bacterium]|nr:LysR family transcriptional regulator [Dissulfurispiraceae bacterium]
MEDHRLQAFCLVYEMRSFSKAAAAKFMTQSAMSHLIKNLEDELGIKLFSRQGKMVSPTPSGKLFYSHVKKILDQYRTMRNAIYAAANIIRGPLTMGATTTISTYLLPQVFYSFSRKHADVKIELAVSNTEKIIDDLREGRIELGIVEGGIKSPFIHSEVIAEDEIVIIASDNNPLTAQKSILITDLMSQDFIMPEPGSGTREFVDDFLKGLGMPVEDLHIAMILGSTELILQMVKSGVGISFVSKWSAFQALKDGSVTQLHVPGKRLKRKFYLIRMDKEPATIATKTFSQFIKEYRFFAPF